MQYVPPPPPLLLPLLSLPLPTPSPVELLHFCLYDFFLYFCYVFNLIFNLIFIYFLKSREQEELLLKVSKARRHNDFNTNSPARHCNPPFGLDLAHEVRATPARFFAMWRLHHHSVCGGVIFVSRRYYTKYWYLLELPSQLFFLYEVHSRHERKTSSQAIKIVFFQAKIDLPKHMKTVRTNAHSFFNHSF